MDVDIKYQSDAILDNYEKPWRQTLKSARLSRQHEQKQKYGYHSNTNIHCPY